jgi:hypothetical protein
MGWALAGERSASPTPKLRMGVPASDGFPRFREIGSFIAFVFLVPAVLWWGFTDLFEHLGIASLRVLLATFDELDNEGHSSP